MLLINQAVEHLIVRLTSDGRLDEFTRMSTNIERVRWMLENIDAFKSCITLPERCLSGLKKSDVEAKQLRLAGNKLFSAKRYKDALLKYNQAVCTASVRSRRYVPLLQQNNGINKVEKTADGYTIVGGSDAAEGGECELALAFANRSATLFHLKRYDECATDVSIAMSEGYPISSSHKLYERLARCYQHLGRFDEANSAIDAAIELLEEKLRQQREQCNENKEIKQDENKEQLQDDPQTIIFLNSLHKLKLEITQIQSKENKANIVNNSEQTGVITKSTTLFNLFEIQSTESRGRFAVSKEKHAIGTVLCSERPFACVLYSSHYKTHCHHCTMRVTLPYPCQSCTNVLYCSPSCSEESWKSYHEFECSHLGDWLSHEFLEPAGHLAYRLLLVTNYQDINKAFDNVNLARNGYSNGNSGYNEQPQTLNYYSSYVSTLVGHETKRDWNEMLAMCALSFLLWQVAQQSNWNLKSSTSHSNNQTDLKSECSDNNAFISAEVGLVTLLRNLQINQCNAFVIADMQPSVEASQDPDSVLWRSKLRDVGMALYPINSLLNHSCNPCAEILYEGNKMSLQAICTIQPGDELTVDYGRLFFTDDEKERQSFFRDHYFFDCQCTACVGHWPVFDDLPFIEPMFRCSYCGMKTLNGECVGCGERQTSDKLKDALRMLDESHRASNQAMMSASRGKVSDAIPALQRHLATMQELLIMPWKEYYGVQATLRQCYRVLTNKSHLKDLQILLD